MVFYESLKESISLKQRILDSDDLKVLSIMGDKIINSISRDACTTLKVCLGKYSDGDELGYSIESSIYADGQDKTLRRNIQNLEKNLKISSLSQIKALKKIIDEHLNLEL